MANTPEKRVKDKIKAQLRTWGWWFFSPVSNGMGAHGIPDIICCAPVTITQAMVGKIFGLMVAPEAKAPGKINNVTALQQMQIDSINAAGGIAFAIDDPNLLTYHYNELYRAHFDCPPQAAVESSGPAPSVESNSWVPGDNGARAEDTRSAAQPRRRTSVAQHRHRFPTAESDKKLLSLVRPKNTV